MVSYTALMKMAGIIANTAYMMNEYILFSRSNQAVIQDLQYGKIGQVYGNATEILAGFASSHDCYALAANKTRSNTAQFLEMGLDREAARTFRNIEHVYDCLQNPYAVMAMTERMAWSNIGSVMQDEVVQDQDQVQDQYPVTVAQSTSDSIISLTTSIQDLVPFIEDNAAFSRGLVHIQDRFVARVHGSKRNVIQYKSGIKYLEQLADPDNDELAQELLNSDDFRKYKAEVERMKVEAAKPDNILNTQSVDSGSSYYAKGRIILGTVYELFYAKSSHTPFLDLINKVRVKILEYVRKLRDNYNYYSDMIQDTGREMEVIAKKTAVAWDRAKWLAANGGLLVAQIGEVLVDDVAPLAIEYVKYII